MAGKLQKLTEQQAAEAVELYEGGASLADCAHIFGVSRQGMWDLLRRRTGMRSGQRYGSAYHFYRGGPIADAYVHNLLEQAIEDGRVVRSDVCEQCGQSGKMKDGRTTIQAHHDDYNEPLDVRWLCQRCHHEWHKNNTATARKEVPQELPQVDLICGGFPLHAKTSVTLGRVRAWLELALACGSNIYASFASFDRDSLSWRTSQRSLLGGWTSYSDRWPKAGTMQSGQAYELPTLVPRTCASGCSSWPTASATDHKTADAMWPTPDAAVSNDGEDLEQWKARRARLKAKGTNGNGCGTPIAVAVRLWPTPTLGDSKASGAAGYSTESGRHSGTTLTDATVRRTWATPHANCANGAGKHGEGSENLQTAATGKLNDAWVTQLMGFPNGWLDLNLPAVEDARRPDGRHPTAAMTRWPAGPHKSQHDWEAPRTVEGSSPGRAARLKALGNAVVPQCAEVIGWVVRCAIVNLPRRRAS